MINLAAIYRDYIACLNRRDWEGLGEEFLEKEVHRNGRPLGHVGYRAMLENDVRNIPDLSFAIDLLVVEAPMVASRLRFDCTPIGQLFGLPINGRRVSFSENVFYRFHENKIAEVWSTIDTAEIESQIYRSI